MTSGPNTTRQIEKKLRACQRLAREHGFKTLRIICERLNKVLRHRDLPDSGLEDSPLRAVLPGPARVHEGTAPKT